MGGKMGNYLTAADTFDDWKNDLLSGEPPTFFRIAEHGPLSQVEVGPRLVTLFGGAPGAGKTAFIMQAVVDALRLDSSLRAVVCNVEMGPRALLDRQLSRLSGVPLTSIRYRSLGEEHADRIDVGLKAIDSIGERLCFVRPPFTLTNVAATVDHFAPLNTADDRLLIVVDYIQRIPIGNRGESTQADRRGAVDASMTYLRGFAEAGAAVLVISSVGRQRDKHGRSSYDSDAMNLASFKESGELEFGADDAWILTQPDESDPTRDLLHLKARYSERGRMRLRFNGSVQQFEAEDDYEGNTGGKMLASLQGLWDSTSTTGGTKWTP
jgi:replicative DNA helicase